MQPLRYLFSALIILFTYSFALAQLIPPDKIRALTTDDGLPQGFVTGVVQDAKGFIWISTPDGLARYDGRSFKNFRHDEAAPASLASNIIDRIVLDHENHIWLQYDNGQRDLFDPVTEKTRHVSQEKAFTWLAAEHSGEYDGVCEDNSNRIYVLSVNDQVLKRKLRYFSWKDQKVVELKLPGGEFPIDMGIDQGNLWVTGNRSLYLSIDHRPLKRICSLPPGLTMPSSKQAFWEFRYIQAFEKGRLLCYNGLEAWTYNISGDSWHKIPIPAAVAGKIVYFEPGRDGFLYFFSGKAVYRIDKDYNFFPIWINDTKNDFINGKIDRSNIIWVGTDTFGVRLINLNNSGFGSYKYNYGTFFDIIPESYRVGVDKNDMDVYIAYSGRSGRDTNGAIWLTRLPYHRIDGQKLTRTGFVMISGEKVSIRNIQLPKPLDTAFYISNFAFDSQNRCWAILTTSLGQDLLVQVDIKNNRFAGRVRITPKGERATYLLAVDDKLCVVYPDALQFYDPQTKQSVFYKNQPGTAVFRRSTLLMAVRDPFKKNILWVSTRGNGMIKFDLVKGTATTLTEKDGLPNNTVYAIVPDKHGYLWCSSNKGIFKFDPVNNRVLVSFLKKDGLQGNEFNRYQFLALPDGHIAFGGTNGGTLFYPDSIKLDSYKTPIAITNIQVNDNELSTYADRQDKPASAMDTLSLPFDLNFLTFHFAGLEYNDPEKLQYRFMLAGVDKKWNNAGSQNLASYSNLAPGSYTFKVNASNTSGKWSDKVKTIYVYISYPWWRTWTAYTCYLIILVLGVRAALRFMNNRTRLKTQLSFEQAETKRIQELDLAKTRFYANISHELRTPLTVILGMARSLAADSAKDLKTSTEMIIRNGQSLLNLVNSMLDLSKLQSGKIVLNCVKGDLITFLRYIVESFHSLAQNQQKQLHFLSELESYYTEYDAEKMRQIISNLLSNALKFTPRGGNIYISINFWELASPNENVCFFIIKIKDTGIGIPEDKLPFIFDRFYQVDSSNSRTTEGTGIGLALTKELVKLMKGKISVKSPPPGVKKGTEFTIELPLEKLKTSYEMIEQPWLHQLEENIFPSENTSQNDGIQSSEISDDKPLILLVEDNADVVAYTASCLPGYRLTVAKDGLEGFEVATELIPDLIISDVMMPRMDGFELLKKIKSDEYTSHIPIIMLTAKADSESRMEGIIKGADAYLEKPFNPDELQIRVNKLLELRKILQMFYLKQAGLSNTQLVATESNERAEPTATESEHKFVIKLRKIIETHISEVDFSVGQLCSEVFMSHSKLHRKLDALTGCAPNKFIRIIRLKKAKELLRDSEVSISSVAIDCGFNDPGYFARVFKQEFGITPNEWRIEAKEL